MESNLIFKRISQLGCKDNDAATTNRGVCITIDMDWAHDAIIDDTLMLLDKYNACATFMVTHSTPIIDAIRSRSKHELGIHPNFNKLLVGEHRHGENYISIIDYLMDIVPEAKAVRAHSLLNSSKLIDALGKRGLIYDLNDLVPSHSGIRVKPWRLWNGMIKVPFIWEDDIHLLYKDYEPASNSLPLNIALEADDKSTTVISFHPIHIFLNSSSISLYEQTRQLHNSPNDLRKFRHKGYGVREMFKELLSGKRIDIQHRQI